MIRSFQGKTPKIHPTAFISETAYLVGHVEVGERANIWPGAVIRADNDTISVGKNVSIQENTVVHLGRAPLTIEDNVLIGHACVVHCVRIGHHCLIGNQATILDGVDIGSYCIVAAGAVVLENTKVPEGSFVVGAPAQVRPLSDKQRERLEHIADHYINRGAEFKAEGLEGPDRYAY